MILVILESPYAGDVELFATALGHARPAFADQEHEQDDVPHEGDGQRGAHSAPYHRGDHVAYARACMRDGEERKP